MWAPALGLEVMTEDTNICAVAATGCWQKLCTRGGGGGEGGGGCLQYMLLPELRTQDEAARDPHCMIESCPAGCTASCLAETPALCTQAASCT